MLRGSECAGRRLLGSVSTIYGLLVSNLFIYQNRSKLMLGAGFRASNPFGTNTIAPVLFPNGPIHRLCPQISMNCAAYRAANARSSVIDLLVTCLTYLVHVLSHVFADWIIGIEYIEGLAVAASDCGNLFHSV